MAKVPPIKFVKPARKMSPEMRDKMSRLAKQRHRDGTSGFGSPEALAKAQSPEARAKAAETRRKRNRSRSASDIVAEAAELNAKELVAVFKDAIDSGQPMGTRLKAAQAWLDVEQTNRKMEMQQEAAEAQQHSRDELIAILAEKLTAGPTAEILRRQLGERAAEVVDAKVVTEDVIDSTATPVG